MANTFLINGEQCSLPDEPMLLIDYLRDHQHLKSVKGACREGDCGSCQVLVKRPLDNRWLALTSCLLPVLDLKDAALMTVDALPFPNVLQKIFSEMGASQCGFCSPGLMMATISWLLNGRHLTVEEGYEAINGNLCRCTGYMGQKRAIQVLVEQWAESLLGIEDRTQYLIDSGLLPAFANKVLPNQATNSAIGGGTDLFLETDIRAASENRLSGEINQSVIKQTDQGLALSALHPIQEVADALREQNLLAVFEPFVNHFASRPVRYRATLGGNLAHASPVGDGLCLMLALDVVVETNQRQFPIGSFYKGFKSSCLESDEIIRWVHVSNETLKNVNLYEKVSRRPMTDIAVVSCASSWKLCDDKVESVRLALGGASAMPKRMRQLEEALQGFPINGNFVDEVLSKVDLEISPISDVRGSKHYRQRLARQLILAQWIELSHGVNNSGS